MPFEKTASRMPDEDPFAQDAGEDYDPDKFYTAARDAKGFAISRRVHFPPNLTNAISIVINSNVIPEIRADSDFVRDALVHETYRLARIFRDRNGDPKAYEQVLQAAEDLRIETQVTMMKNRAERIATMLQDAKVALDGTPAGEQKARKRQQLREEFSTWSDPDEREHLLSEVP